MGGPSFHSIGSEIATKIHRAITSMGIEKDKAKASENESESESIRERKREREILTMDTDCLSVDSQRRVGGRDSGVGGGSGSSRDGSGREGSDRGNVDRSRSGEPVVYANPLSSRLPVIDSPSLVSFMQILTESQPVILKGISQSWPCLSKWNDLSYLRSVAGYRTVPVEVGSHYAAQNWNQSLMTLNEFIDQFLLRKNPSGPIGYIAQTELFNQIPELSRDFQVPDYCSLGESESLDPPRVNVWFGPNGTVSPLHYDPSHNIFCQISGRKYWRLYPPSASPSLYPHSGDRLLGNTSQITDLQNVDSGRFPLFAECPYFECVLDAGDSLYVPPKWWHCVRSLSVSFSLSFWFD
eukprot:TRINITY_DN1158_c7_g1_i1.p1 TRINITY_DN1158_c7_g1~~TRINITY_DN1158_c7_g1_i1.p1  ORF type:complete len:401 (-),score=76.91 TRINITY_DN1158_c7_g1_i1:26-1084(-)